MIICLMFWYTYCELRAWLYAYFSSAIFDQNLALFWLGHDGKIIRKYFPVFCVLILRFVGVALTYWYIMYKLQVYIMYNIYRNSDKQARKTWSRYISNDEGATVFTKMTFRPLMFCTAYFVLYYLIVFIIFHKYGQQQNSVNIIR